MSMRREVVKASSIEQTAEAHVKETAACIASTFDLMTERERRTMTIEVRWEFYCHQEFRDPLPLSKVNDVPVCEVPHLIDATVDLFRRHGVLYCKGKDYHPNGKA